MNHAQRRHLPALADVVRFYTVDMLSSTVIAAQYGCHAQSIRHMLKRAGINVRGKQEAAMLSVSEWTPERVALLKELWPTGMSIPEIHNRLGISYGLKSVSNKAKSLGMTMRANPVKPAKPKPAVVAVALHKPKPPIRSLVTFLPESPRLEMEFRHLVAKVRAERGVQWTELLGVER